MKYYIWSHRHDQWWGPDRQGYSNSLAAAGLYSATEAADIVLSALPGADVAVDTHFEARFIEMGTEEVKEELETLRRL